MTPAIDAIIQHTREIEDLIDLARQQATERDKDQLFKASERLLDAAVWIGKIEKEIRQ